MYSFLLREKMSSFNCLIRSVIGNIAHAARINYFTCSFRPHIKQLFDMIAVLMQREYTIMYKILYAELTFVLFIIKIVVLFSSNRISSV